MNHHRLRYGAWLTILVGTVLSAPRVAPAVGSATAADPMIDTRGKLEIRSADDHFRWRIDGRIHADAAWFEDRGRVDFGSGTQLRRARLGMNGRLWRHWEFKFAYDFTGSGSTAVQDAFLRYTGVSQTTLTVGHFKEPISLEVLTGANDIPFVERSLPTALAPSRSLGLAATRLAGERMAATLGLFGEGIAKLSDTDDATQGLDEGWAVSGRLIFTPVRADTRLVHLGGSASYRRTNDHAGTHLATPFRIRQRPEASLTSVRLVDTGDLSDADALVTWGLEAAWVRGPLSLQGEYLAMTVERNTPSSIDPVLRGFYVMGSWLLSGESRRRNEASSAFANPRVGKVAGIDGSGAWELLARFSRLDLTDRPACAGGVAGGLEDNATLGLTWYPNDNLRFMLNYVKVLAVDRPGHAYDGIEPAIVLLRTQVIW
jgi:phosphate-selective porin OprO/OprP